MPVTVPNSARTTRSSHCPTNTVRSWLEPEDPDDPYCP
jgi:hypothetical protein